MGGTTRRGMGGGTYQAKASTLKNTIASCSTSSTSLSAKAASLAAKEGKTAEAQESSEKAKKLLSSFAEKADSSYYLKLRSQDSLAALKRSKIV